MTNLLASCDMSVVFTTDLSRYLKGALDHKWPMTPVRESMKSGGFVPCLPPTATYLGEVMKVFPKRSVIGMIADADPPLNKDEMIVVWSNAGFEVLKAESLVQNNKPSDTITKGESAGQVTFDVKKVIEGSFVARLAAPPAEASPTNLPPPAPVTPSSGSRSSS